MLSEVAFEYTWVGYVSLSKNSAPACGRYRRNVYVVDCLDSLGLTHGHRYRHADRRLRTGNDNPLIADLEALGRPVRLPPQPFSTSGPDRPSPWWTWRGRREQ